jgi:hypothetical protein
MKISDVEAKLGRGKTIFAVLVPHAADVPKNKGRAPP